MYMETHTNKNRQVTTYSTMLMTDADMGESPNLSKSQWHLWLRQGRMTARISEAVSIR